jgi:hypothetical protein
VVELIEAAAAEFERVVRQLPAGSTRPSIRWSSTDC